MEPEEETIPTCIQKFGVIKKVTQKPKPEDEDTPYWASMHKYDMSLPNWGKFNIRIQPFQQSGFKHYFGVVELVAHQKLRRSERPCSYVADADGGLIVGI